MTRTVAALYDTRAEAEFARARLVSRMRARSPRIIGRDTAAAVDDLGIAPAAADAYRDGIRGGAHLLVAQVPSNTRPERIIELLTEAAGHDDPRGDQHWGDAEHGVRVDLSEDFSRELADDAPPPERPANGREQPPSATAPPAEKDAGPIALPAEEARTETAEAPEPPAPPAPPRTARVRSFTREAPAEKQVSLNEEVVEVETRAADRQLSDSDVEAGGLFQERVFEIAAMREEPVVTKVAVVREEVIVRKTLKARVETIRDTVRHTEVDVEALAGETGAATGLLGRPSE